MARSNSGPTVAQKWRVARLKPNRNTPSLDSAALERLALRYVERYATTRARLTRYLERKLYERGWEGAGAPPTEDIVRRFVERGYVDDQMFATFRSESLLRRGYGERRVAADLRAAGIAEEDRPSADPDKARAAALAYARRKRIGPFATTPMDPAAQKRAFAAMMRAGHAFALAREVIDIPPDDPEFEWPGTPEGA